jgi:hypothetical protein
LPSAKEAVQNPGRYTQYILDPENPVGGNKARLFQSILGYNKSNYQSLVDQIAEGVTEDDAIDRGENEYGHNYRVDIPDVEGPNGKTATVRTNWFIDKGSTIPRLISAWPLKTK